MAASQPPAAWPLKEWRMSNDDWRMVASLQALPSATTRHVAQSFLNGPFDKRLTTGRSTKKLKTGRIHLFDVRCWQSRKKSKSANFDSVTYWNYRAWNLTFVFFAPFCGCINVTGWKTPNYLLSKGFCIQCFYNAHSPDGWCRILRIMINIANRLKML